MVSISCCPNFKFRSFVFLKIIVDISLYLITLLYNGLNRDGSLLSPLDSSLYALGEKFPYFIKNDYEIYRLLTSLFMNLNIFQIISNVFGHMIFASYVEKLIGFFKTFFVFCIFGIGGALFSCLFKNDPMVDSSSATMGFIGLEFGNLLICWEIWDYPGSGKYQMICILIIGIIVNFSLAGSFDQIDTVSMIGSLILGILLSFVLISSDMNLKKKNKCFKYLSLFLIILYFLIASLVFCFYTNPYLI